MKVIARYAVVVITTVLACATPARAQLLRVAGDGADGGSVPVPTLASREQPLDSTLLRWQTVREGMQHAELELRAGAAGIPVRAILVRLEPRLFEFRLQVATEKDGMTGAWSIAAAPADAALAVNAGQFREAGPWGWLVVDGRERSWPGRGPLAATVAFDTAGRVRWLGDQPAASIRRGRGAFAQAFQSFPVLLHDGRVPSMIRHGAPALDLGHRDARLVLGEDRAGRLLLLLTRFDVLGGAAGRLPIGLTVPESAALARSLGLVQAVMLDGGLSGQLLVRDADGGEREWKGMRRVPVGLVAIPRGGPPRRR